MADDRGAFAEEINRILGNIGASEKLNTEAAVSAFRAEVVKDRWIGSLRWKNWNEGLNEVLRNDCRIIMKAKMY